MRIVKMFAVVTLLTLVAAGSSAAAENLPRTADEAIARYESDPDHWLEGPVQYLILDSEKEAFEGLSSTPERKRFIEEFWDRRDQDLRDRTNPYKIAFYERVAAANQRYRDRPWTGWKSDRGRLHVLLGAPDHVRGALGNNSRFETWTYYTIGPRGNDRPFSSTFGELQVYFYSRGLNRYEIVGDFGPGTYPRYVREMMQYAREAAVDPNFRRTAS